MKKHTILVQCTYEVEFEANETDDLVSQAYEHCENGVTFSNDLDPEFQVTHIDDTRV